MPRQREVARLKWDDDDGDRGAPVRATSLGLGQAGGQGRRGGQESLAGLANQARNKGPGKATRLQSQSKGRAAAGGGRGKGGQKLAKIGSVGSKRASNNGGGRKGSKAKRGAEKKEKKKAISTFGSKVKDKTPRTANGQANRKRGGGDPQDKNQKRDESVGRAGGRGVEEEGLNVISAAKLLGMIASSPSVDVEDYRRSPGDRRPYDDNDDDEADNPSTYRTRASVAPPLHIPDESPDKRIASPKVLHDGDAYGGIGHKGHKEHGRHLRQEDSPTAYGSYKASDEPYLRSTSRLANNPISPLPVGTGPAGGYRTEREREREEKRKKQEETRRALEGQMEERRISRLGHREALPAHSPMANAEGYRDEYGTPIRSNGTGAFDYDPSRLSKRQQQEQRRRELEEQVSLRAREQHPPPHRAAANTRSPPRPDLGRGQSSGGGVTSVQFGGGLGDEMSEKRKKQLELKRQLEMQVEESRRQKQNQNQNQNQSHRRNGSGVGHREAYTPSSHVHAQHMQSPSYPRHRNNMQPPGGMSSIQFGDSEPPRAAPYGYGSAASPYNTPPQHDQALEVKKQQLKEMLRREANSPHAHGQPTGKGTTGVVQTARAPEPDWSPRAAYLDPPHIHGSQHARFNSHEESGAYHDSPEKRRADKQRALRKALEDQMREREAAKHEQQRSAASRSNRQAAGQSENRSPIHDHHGPTTGVGGGDGSLYPSSHASHGAPSSPTVALLNENRSKQLGSSLFGGDRQYNRQLSEAEKRRQHQEALKEQMEEKRRRKEEEKRREEEAEALEERRLRLQQEQLLVEARQSGVIPPDQGMSSPKSPKSSSPVRGSRMQYRRDSVGNNGRSSPLPPAFANKSLSRHTSKKVMETVTSLGQAGSSPTTPTPNNNNNNNNNVNKEELAQLSSMFEKLVEEQNKLKRELQEAREEKQAMERERNETRGRNNRSPTKPRGGGGSKRGKGRGRPEGQASSAASPTKASRRRSAGRHRKVEDDGHLPELSPNPRQKALEERQAILQAREERRNRIFAEKKAQRQGKGVGFGSSAASNRLDDKEKKRKERLRERQRKKAEADAMAVLRRKDRHKTVEENRPERRASEVVKLRVVVEEPAGSPIRPKRYSTDIGDEVQTHTPSRGRTSGQHTYQRSSPISQVYTPTSNPSRARSRTDSRQRGFSSRNSNSDLQASLGNLGGMSSFIKPRDVGLSHEDFEDTSTGDDASMDRRALEDIMRLQLEALGSPHYY